MFLTHLVDDILDYSKMEFNNFELNFEWFTFKEVV
jgi:K+-sensing histidine kinase KdpD